MCPQCLKIEYFLYKRRTTAHWIHFSVCALKPCFGINLDAQDSNMQIISSQTFFFYKKEVVQGMLLQPLLATQVYFANNVKCITAPLLHISIQSQEKGVHPYFAIDTLAQKPSQCLKYYKGLGTFYVFTLRV